MPVLIVGASCDIGRRLAGSLRDEDAQVRVYVEEDDPGFRSMGCKVAVGEYDDIGRIESAMEQVHTVVHLAPSLDPSHGRTLEWMAAETTDVAVRAAVSADVVRFLLASGLGADPASDNTWLRALGEAEQFVTMSGLQHAVLRCAPVVGKDTPLARSLASGRRSGVAPPPGTQRLNPVWSGDVARALYAADARGADVTGTWEIGGPETFTFDELVRRATGRDRVAHRRSVPGLPNAVANAYRTDRVADSQPFRAQFGFQPDTRIERAMTDSGA